MKSLYLGMDVGAVSANTIIMDGHRNVLEEHYTRIKGQPLQTVEKVLEGILQRISHEQFHSVSFTGTGGKLLAELLGGNFINEIIAQARAVQYFYPQVRTVIDIGGEDSKLILIEEEGGRFKIGDFSMNTLCAAGTGSFLDQQASRLGLTIEEFGQLALKSTNPPRIAGRCSVFAKSDMIHLQQIATPDFDIVAGLCFAVARNFKSTIGKGFSLRPPLSFQGGVAANLGMRRAFAEVLELDPEEFIIPKYFASMGAIGACLLAIEGPAAWKKWQGWQKLETYITASPQSEKAERPLSPSPHKTPPRRDPFTSPDNEKKKGYLGVDVGSISTNVVVIDEQKQLLAKRYLMTDGRPIEAIKQGLKEVGEELNDRGEIRGVGTTGSGRYLTGDFIGADIVRNELN